MSDDKQDTFAVVNVERVSSQMDYGDDTEKYETRNQKGSYGYYHPKNIHAGPQALMNAVVDELGEQVSLECLLKRLEGRVRYKNGLNKGDLYFDSIQLELCTATCDDTLHRLIFLTPAPKEDTLAARARKLRENIQPSISGPTVEWAKEAMGLVGELAEKLEGGEE